MVQGRVAFIYDIVLEAGEKERFIIQLQKPDLILISDDKSPPPDWVSLQYNKCENCPLTGDSNKYCPIARNLASVLGAFATFSSHDKANVTITCEARQYKKAVPLSDGLASLIGIYMVTSGCPIMDKLRPMVYTHLPFATPDETIYRAIAMYLMAQYFRKKAGKSSDWNIQELVNIYEEVRKVNVGFTKRLHSVAVKDANITALVNLDSYAILTSSTILDDCLGEYEAIFKAYF